MRGGAAGNYPSPRVARWAPRSMHSSMTTPSTNSARRGGAVPAGPGCRFSAVGARARADANTVEWALRDGIGAATGGAAGRAGVVAHRVAGLDGVETGSRAVGGVGVDITHIHPPHYGHCGQNLPISNNFQQTHSGSGGFRVDMFGRCVRSRAPFSAPRTVSENTKFLDNDFITASR